MRPLLTLLHLLPFTVLAQSYSSAERLQGYALAGDSTVFLFDAELYEKQPQRVVVTGAFRGWSQDMDEALWQLKKVAPSLWMLPVANPDNNTIGPSGEFKFRTDDGEWLSPPADAPNNVNGNLVYLFGVKPPTLKAELRNPNAIWIETAGFDRPHDPRAYRLTNAEGGEIPIAAFLPNTATEGLLVPVQPIDPRRVYYLSIRGKDLKTVCSFDGWFRELYSAKALGANVSANKRSTAFRVFAPRATRMVLYLYND